MKDALRLNPYEVSPDSMKAMVALDAHVRESGFDPALAELVKIRVSQINGCAYCLWLHRKEARAKGLSEEKLGVLAAWHESPTFSARERAALRWAEALTRLPESHAGDSAYSEVSSQFDPEEQVRLTLLIVTINSWNRFAVGFRYLHPTLE